jgi:hypothetical protein
VRHPRLKGLKKSYFWQHVAAIAKPR